MTNADVSESPSGDFLKRQKLLHLHHLPPLEQFCCLQGYPGKYESSTREHGMTDRARRCVCEPCEHVCACGCDAGGRVERQIMPCHSSCILSVLPPSLLPWTLPTLFTLAWPHTALDTARSSFLGSHHPQRGLEEKLRSVLD